MTENGPYIPSNYPYSFILIPADEKGGLSYNPISWTNFASVVYLEAPAGVGFSYSNISSDYYTNDLKTAKDNYLFLENFLLEYPNFIGNPIFLSGESYGGTYIPTVTQQILLHPNSFIY